MSVNLSAHGTEPLEKSSDQADRQAWLSTLAKAPTKRLCELWSQTGLSPIHDVLRAPEVGAVMVRGRAGAVGAAFNLGEMSVTRCSVQLRDGPVGHGYVQGRSKDHAMIAALIDALMQTDQAIQLRSAVLQPLEKEEAETSATRQAKAAATKVEFFTMARGED